MMRVPDLLMEQRVPYEILIHPPAYTSQKRAKCLHVSGKQLAKCVLLARERGFILAVLPATDQVDLDQLSALFEQPVRLASDEEVAGTFCDCEWGVAMPFGSLYGLPTILEDSFDAESHIIFEAHFHAVTIRMRCRDFETLEKPRRLRFAKPIS
jgi:Ala-tRNA(Pro) deacylase